MTEQPKPAPFNIDLNTILPTIANLYKQLSWMIPIAEKIGGFKIPPEIIKGLESLSSGKPLTAEEMQAMKTSIETMQPAVGEPVMTRELAETAWFLHTKEGMGTREIAETLTKDGSPCSHATVARWINIVDAQKRFGKIARLIQIGKFLGYSAIIVVAFVIGRTFF